MATTGGHWFDEVTLNSTDNTATFTFNSKDGTTFNLYQQGSSLNIYLDNAKINYSYHDGLTFSDNTTHTVTVSLAGTSSYSSATVSAFILHPATGNETVVRSITLTEAGDLEYYLTDENLYYVKKLTLSGPMNGADMKIIRTMGSRGALVTLNLANAEMVAGGGACGTYDYSAEGYYGWTNYSETIYTRDNAISDGQFYNLSQLQEITLPSTITSIGKYAFSGCSSLQTITFPTALKTVGTEAFAYCNALTKPITTDVNAWAQIDFNGEPTSNPVYYTHKLYTTSGSVLTNVSLNSSCTKIGSYAFAYNTSITSLTLPAGMTDIGVYAFSGCTALKTIEANGGMGRVGTNAFYGCTAITSVNTNNLKEWCESFFAVTDEGYDLYDSNGNILESTNGEEDWNLQKYKPCIYSNPTTFAKSLKVNNSLISELTIPSDAAYIGTGAFANCSNITTVRFPEGCGVRNVYEMAFEGCTNLAMCETGNLSEWAAISFWRHSCQYYNGTVTADEEDSGYYYLAGNTWGYFYTSNPTAITGKLYCSGEPVGGNVVLPEGTAAIGSYAFYGLDDITSLTLPATTTKVSGNAILGCSSLLTVKCLATTPPEVASYYDYVSDYNQRTYYFPDLAENITLQVPFGSSGSYASANGWKDMKEIVELKPKCATPTISCKDGKLHFDCETEGVTYHSTTVLLGAEGIVGNDISLPSTYRVTVYATKENYDNSDVVSEVVTLGPAKAGDVDGDGKVTINDAVKVVDIILAE